MIKEDLKSTVQDMIVAPSCHPDLQAAGKAWLYEFGKEGEPQAAHNLVIEAEACLQTVDGLVAFVNSPAAKKIFGDNFDNFYKHVEELKAGGAEYCDCAACKAAKVVLDNQSVILN